QANALDTIFNLLLSDLKRASQLSRILPLMGKIFALSSPPIWIKGLIV
ncbi:9809_t:CDS:1, partial [Dentiscutata heterogama]